MDCQDRSAHNQTGIKKNTIVDKSSVQMATAGRPTTRLPAILRCAAVMQPPCNFDFLFLAPPGTGPSLSRRARRANGDLPRTQTGTRCVQPRLARANSIQLARSLRVFSASSPPSLTFFFFLPSLTQPCHSLSPPLGLRLFSFRPFLLLPISPLVQLPSIPSSRRLSLAESIEPKTPESDVASTRDRPIILVCFVPRLDHPPSAATLIV